MITLERCDEGHVSTLVNAGTQYASLKLLVNDGVMA